MQIHWLDILPLMVLNAGGLIVFCAGAFLPRRPPWLLFWLSVLAPLGAGAAAVLVTPTSPDFLGLLDLSSYARFFTILILVITFLTLLFLHRYSLERGFANDELFALILYPHGGMVLWPAALEWLIVFVG